MNNMLSFSKCFLDKKLLSCIFFANYLSDTLSEMEHLQMRLCQIDVRARPKGTWLESHPMAAQPQASLSATYYDKDS